MRRAALLIAVILALLVLAGLLLWYFAYGMQATTPSDASVPGLTAPAQIEWHEEGLVAIHAETEADRHAALGYVHGRRHGWPLALWKRTAEGRLASWFGAELLPADRLARRLGLAARAREAYARLPDDDQALLQAYVAGLNAALDDPSVQGQDPFILLELTPTRWQAWHPLAIEHLFAWLSTTPTELSDSTGHPLAAADSFRTADRLLRRWLHLFGFEHSTAWTARTVDGTAFFRRIVYGDAALPMLQEVAFIERDSAFVLGATLPGTPFFLTGQTHGRTWTILPASTSSLVRLPAAAFSAQPTHDRIEDEQGNEYLVTRYHADNMLALEAPPTDTLRTDTLRTDTLASDAAAGPDSVLALRWTGLRPITDWQAWRALVAGQEAAFALQRGDGLRLDDGEWRVTGSPQVVQPYAEGVAVGNTFWTRYVAQRLDTLATVNPDSVSSPSRWVDDCYSTWAGSITPTLLAAVDSVAFDTTSDVFDDALVYLRNWDYSYDRASIGASIFEAWVHQYHGLRDERPTPLAPADTSLGEAYIRADLLRTAVDSLARRYGDALSQWRWERVHHVTLAFPVWAADSLVTATELEASGRYAALERPGRGHPSAPCGGTTPVGAALSAPASWHGFSTTARPERLYAGQRAFRVDRFLDRYRIPTRPPPARLLHPFAQPDNVTVLHPPRQ